MEAVHEAMDHRGDEKADAAQEGDAGEQGVGGSEELRAVGFHAIDWPHAGQDHGSVDDGVDPAEAGDEVVSGRADTHRNDDERQKDEGAPSDAAYVGGFGEQRLAS